MLRVSISTSVGVAAWELIPTFRPEMHNGELVSISVTSALGVIYVFPISVFCGCMVPFVRCPLSVVRCHFLFTQSAIVAFVELAAEAFFYFDIEFLAEWLELDLVDDLSHEGVLEQRAGFGFGDAALAHIEEC